MILFSVLTGWPLTLLLCISTAAAAPSDPKSPPDYTAIAASTFLGDPNAYKMTYIALVRQATETEIKANSTYRNFPSEADNFRNAEMQAALSYVNGDHFNGYVAPILKDAANVGLGLTTDELSTLVPHEFINKTIDDYLTSLEKNGHTPELDPTLVGSVTTWMLDAAKNPTNPDHEWAVEQVTTYLKLDPSIDYAFLPQVQQKIENQTVHDLLDELLEQEKQGANTRTQDREALVQLNLKAQALLDQLGKEANSIKQQTESAGKDQTSEEKAQRVARAKEIETSLDELSKGFGAAAGISRLLHDDEAARVFQNAQALSENFMKLVALSIDKTFSEEPAAYTNTYAAIALLVVNMLNQSKEQDGMNAIYARLVDISKQIEELRKQMQQNFDMLEFKADNYFRQNFFDLENIKATTSRLENMGNQILNEMTANDAEITSGLKQLWLNSLTDWQTLCLSVTPNGKNISRSTELIQRCRNQFAQMATSTWETPLLNPLPNSDTFKTFQQISDQEYRTLKDTLAKFDPSETWNQAQGHPFNFLYGARMFVDLFAKNPGNRAYVNDSNIGRSDLSFDNMLKIGTQTTNGLKQLLLTEQRDQYELKSDFLLKLLVQYREEAIAAIRQGEEKSSQFAYGGPRPSLGARDPIIVDDTYEFLKKRIDWCDPKTGKLEIGQFYNSWGSSPASAWTLPDARIGFNKDWFSWNRTFLPIIPPAMVWASRMGPNAEYLDITPCFRKFELPNLIIGVAVTHIEWRIELEFRGRIGEGDPHQEFAIGKAILDDDYIYKPGVGTLVVRGQHPQPLSLNLWAGQKCVESCDFNWPAVILNGAQHFQPVDLTDKEVDPKYSAYKKRLQSLWNNNFSLSQKSLNNDLQADQTISAKRLIFILANLGLDPKVPAADDFINWLANEDSLPSREHLAQFALESDMKWDEILKIVDNKLAVARQEIEELAKAKDLQPRIIEFDQVLKSLKAL